MLHAFHKQAPASINFQIVDISDLPLINQDLEENLPGPVKKLHATIEAADAVLFATPEYNRSYSPVIKNVIDWGSRPAGTNKWDKKPAGVIGCSPYSLGAFGAVNHLRQVLLYVNVSIIQQPEFYLSNIGKMMNEKGEITDPVTQQMIDKFWKAFVGWIELTGKK